MNYRDDIPLSFDDGKTINAVIEIPKGTFDAGDILVRKDGVKITSETRFSDLSVELAT